MRLLCCLLLCLSVACSAAPGDALPRSYTAPWNDESPVIDGRLDDDVWAAAAWSEEFADIRGMDHPAPTFRTRMKMAWGPDGLAIGAELVEPHVWATLTERDSIIFHDPDFEVFIDPDSDGLRYFELEINALGTEWDLLLPKRYTDGGEADHDWTMEGLRTAIHVDGTINDSSDDDRGWNVEMLIPWAAVERGMPQPDERWRINFSRVEWHVIVEDGAYVKDPAREGEDHPEENWVWSPQGLIDMHQPETWGSVVFAGPR